MKSLLIRIWRWITFYEDPPKNDHERRMRKFSRTTPTNEGNTPVPRSGPGPS